MYACKILLTYSYIVKPSDVARKLNVLAENTSSLVSSRLFTKRQKPFQYI